MARNDNRLAAVAHYVIARTEPEKLGATKLNKILWHSDLEYYRRHGETITGSESYIREKHGPVPRGMPGALAYLKRAGMISERSAPVITHTRREFVWQKEPDLTQFTAEQIDIVNRVISIIKEQTAEEASHESHGSMWEELENGTSMPVGAASIIARKPTELEIEWAEAQDF